MPCYHPLLAYKCDGKVVFDKPFAFAKGFNLPCGQCIGCRLEYSRQWAMRCVHEAQMHEDNCFITLTFNDEALKQRRNPKSLDVDEFQRFMKRLRKRYDHKIRFFHCGEYGDQNGRPHYHALLFGHDFKDKKLWSKKGGFNLFISEQLMQLWPHGFSTIGAVTFETAAYCARYVMKKVTGEGAPAHYREVDLETGEIISERKSEYCTMSRMPGIGYDWYQMYGWTDCHLHDFVVVNGKEVRPPKYYDKLFKQVQPEKYEKLKQQRIEAADDPITNYDKRMDDLWVSEEIKIKKLERLIRNL
jgi:hypothetical protein